MPVANYIRQLIELVGKQRAAAALMGVNESTLSKYLRDERGIGLEPVLRLAAALGTAPAELLGAAGKHDMLELLESSFGPAAKAPPAPLPRDRQRLLDAFALLSERDQAIVERNIIDMQPAGSPFAKPHARGAHHRVAQRKRAG